MPDGTPMICVDCERHFVRAFGSKRIRCETCNPPKGTGGKTGIRAEGYVKPEDGPHVPGPLETKVTAELERIGQADTLEGAIAITMAETAERPGPEAGKMACRKQMMENVAICRARAGIPAFSNPTPASPEDEITRRIREKREAAMDYPRN